jgi:hypothetical protein
MADATVTTRFLPGPVLEMEAVNLTVSDGETYVSTLSKPLFAVLTAAVDDDGELNYTLSGRTFTIQAAGMTDKLVTMVIWGYK